MDRLDRGSVFADAAEGEVHTLVENPPSQPRSHLLALLGRPSVLEICAEAGDVEGVRRALENFNEVSGYDGPAAYRAALSGHRAVVLVLLKSCAAGSARRRLRAENALKGACHAGHMSLVKELVPEVQKEGAAWGTSWHMIGCIYEAMRGDKIDVLKFLLTHSVPLDDGILFYAINQGNLGVVRVLVEAWRPTTKAIQMILTACVAKHRHILTFLNEVGYVTEAAMLAVSDASAEGFSGPAFELYAEFGGALWPGAWEQLENYPEDTALRVAVFHRRKHAHLLPGRYLRVWFLFHVRYKERLCAKLTRVRSRLDHPPTEPLHKESPTREELAAHLRTAGRAFAREYWTDGLPIFFPSLDLGPVPEEFVYRPL